MKKIYILLAFALISGAVSAQTKSAVKFGLRGGVNISTVAASGSDVTEEDKDAINSITSYQIGGYASIPVSKTFSVQPGLTLSGKGFNLKFSETEVDPEFGIPVTTTVEVTENLMYLEIPVNAVFNFNGFYIGAGPYLAYGISGKDKVSMRATGGGVTLSTEDESDVKFGSGEDEVKPLDYGLNALAGYQLKNGLNFGLNYGLGLGKNANTTNGDNSNFSNRVFSVLVGFSF